MCIQSAYGFIPLTTGCVYVTDKDLSIEEIKAGVNFILGCGDAAVNKVNGRCYLGESESPPAICLSDGSGCGDCLYVNLLALRRTSLTISFPSTAAIKATKHRIMILWHRARSSSL